MLTQRRILRPSSNQFLLDFYSQLVLRLESFIWSLREVVAVFRHKLQLKFGSKVANSVHKFTLKVHSDMKISLFIFSLCLRICLSFFSSCLWMNSTHRILPLWIFSCCAVIWALKQRRNHRHPAKYEFSRNFFFFLPVIISAGIRRGFSRRLLFKQTHNTQWTSSSSAASPFYRTRSHNGSTPSTHSQPTITIHWSCTFATFAGSSPTSKHTRASMSAFARPWRLVWRSSISMSTTSKISDSWSCG